MLLLLRLLNKQNRLMDEKKEGEGGGGGGGEKKETPPDHAKEIADLKSTIEEMKKMLTKSKDEPDLTKKADDQKAQKDKELAGTKALESAVKFNLKSGEFIKNNEALLPKDFKGILEAAEKETYESEVAKSNDVKSAMIKKFFEPQANMDLLTQGQKTVLEEYLKMTNTARQEKASEIYDMVFEPAIEKLKAMKKAEALNKGHAAGSDHHETYKNKLIAKGKERFLGEKQNA